MICWCKSDSSSASGFQGGGCNSLLPLTPVSQLIFFIMLGSLFRRPKVGCEMTKKSSYEEVRCWLLDCYYQYCWGKLIGEKQWAPDEFEFGYVYDQVYACRCTST